MIYISKAEIIEQMKKNLEARANVRVLVRIFN